MSGAGPRIPVLAKLNNPDAKLGLDTCYRSVEIDNRGAAERWYLGLVSKARWPWSWSRTDVGHVSTWGGGMAGISHLTRDAISRCRGSVRRCFFSL